MLKFQRDSAIDDSTLTITTFGPFEKKQDKPYKKEDMNPKSFPLDLNSGGTSAAFADADEIPLTVRHGVAFLGVLRLKVPRNERTVCLPPGLIL